MQSKNLLQKKYSHLPVRKLVCSAFTNNMHARPILLVGLFLGLFAILSSTVFSQSHPCSLSNITLLHWNQTDPNLSTNRYPIYFPQLPSVQFLIDIDGASQPYPLNDAAKNDTLFGTTFAMMFHTMNASSSEKHFHKSIYIMNSRLGESNVQKLMDCNNSIEKNASPYCDKLLLLTNAVNTNSRVQYFLWNVISGRQYGPGGLSENVISYLYTSDLTQYALHPNVNDDISVTPIIVPNPESDPIYSASTNSVTGFETVASASVVSSEINVKPISMAGYINPTTQQNDLLVLHKSKTNAIRLLRLTPFHEGFGIDSTKIVLLPTISGDGITESMFGNNVKFILSKTRKQVHVFFTLYRKQQESFEKFHSLEHNKVIKFSDHVAKEASMDFVNVLVTVDISSDTFKVSKIVQLFTTKVGGVKSLTSYFESDNVHIWHVNDMALSGDSEQVLVLVGTISYTDEGETDKNSFIYTVDLDSYQAFSAEEVERYSVIMADDVEIDNSEGFSVTANFYGMNDTIAVGSVVRTRSTDEPIYQEPDMVGYVHLFSASNLQNPLGYKIMRQHQGIARIFQVEMYPDQTSGSMSHVFLGWNIRNAGAVISTLSFSCTIPLVREGWQYMLIGVFGGEFVLIVLIAVLYFVVKKIKAKFGNKETAYERV